MIDHIQARLRTDPALREAYVARKREILAAGVDDPVDYSLAKEEFIAGALTPRKAPEPSRSAP